MSRIGNKAITLPAGVSVNVAEGNFVTVKGPKGELSFQFNSELEIATEGSECVVKRPTDTKTMKMMHGTTRALLHNMVVGVSDGFKKVLEINGVGYRAALQGNTVVPLTPYPVSPSVDILYYSDTLCITNEQRQIHYYY